MHLAFVSQFDARDPRAWSGIPWRIAAALRDQAERVSLVTPLRTPRHAGAAIRAARARLRGQTFLRQHTFAVARAYAEEASTQLRRLRPDVVLAPSSLPLALLDTDAPTAFWADATFESNLFRYGLYSNMSEEAVAEGHALEAAVFSRVACAFYAGEHAARSAVDYYGVSEERVFAVPFGANLPEIPGRDEVVSAIEARAAARCQLLFIGQEWTRKGGDVAVRVAAELNRRGIPAVLRVVGVTPPIEPLPDFVRLEGFIPKNTDEGRERLHRLLLESHFLIQPARAENFGCVYCEASAYGVPSVAAAVDGVPLAVRDDVNGLLFEPRPAADAIVDRVEEFLQDPDRYGTLARTSRDEFEGRLNWSSAVSIVLRTLRAAVEKSKSRE